MKQYGDITKLSGYDLEPVDLIVGGSPCQDLSVAGKRAGLEGDRSGLFMEMIRIIKEMREKTNGIYPRYALWENVPGAFSSNDGRDFSAVLGEFSRIIEPDAPDVPCPEEGWPKAGILLVSNGALAWRTHDAQYWGVPQRRRRISVIVDLRGQSAAEILFERKSMPRNPEKSGTERERNTGDIEKSAGNTEDSINATIVFENHAQDARYKKLESNASQPVSAHYGTGGNNQPFVVSTERLSNSLVRRLTPLECERLQGFPDGWTAIPGASDSARYRALGNSIALPFGSSSLIGL